MIGEFQSLISFLIREPDRHCHKEASLE